MLEELELLQFLSQIQLHEEGIQLYNHKLHLLKAMLLHVNIYHLLQNTRLRH